MKVKKLLLSILFVAALLALFGSCDLFEKDDPADPQVRIQVESSNETWYFAVGTLNGNTFYNSIDWIIASGGYSDFVSVEEGTYIFGYDDTSDHSQIGVITYANSHEPIEFVLKKDKKYTIIFGADGQFYLPDFPDL